MRRERERAEEMAGAAKISDSHREELAQLETEMHRMVEIPIRKDKQERMKKEKKRAKMNFF